jgi:holliday junction DNA helicase RuvA
MIGFVQGKAISDGVVLTAAGVGVSVSTPKALTVGEEVELWVTTVVRQDAVVCFGFPTRDEQHLFASIIKVPGVGPSAALGLLGALGVDGFLNAVAAGDVATLKKAPGVGAAAAGRILSNIKIPGGITASTPPQPSLIAEVAATLEGLGFEPGAALKAVQTAHGSGVQSEDELLAGALDNLRKETK